MTSFWDFQPYYEQLGIRKVEAKADCSDLKNKMGDDLTNGHPRQYIDNVLNPLNDAFLSTVRTCRPQLAQLADDHPALRGETYFTEQAVEVGLCDGQRTFDEALHECHELGKAWQQATRQKQSLYTLL